MAMFLGGCPVFLIMMISPLSSNAFLRYICKQVKEFNHSVLQKLLTHMFHRHIPNYLSPTVSHLDPRQCNHPDNAAKKNQCRGGHGSSSQVACFFPVCLSTTTTIEGRETMHITLSTQRTYSLALLETWKWKMVKASLLAPTRLGEGF
jgi:hypothetical protein